MEGILADFEAKMQQEVQHLMDRMRKQVANILDAARREWEERMAEVQTKRAQLSQEVESMAKLHEAQSGMIELNVGGWYFTTSVQTLRSKPGSMLDAMLSGRYSSGKDADGRVFIDRDGECFGHVLEYLRDGVVCVDGLDCRTLRQLKHEFVACCSLLLVVACCCLLFHGNYLSQRN